MVRQLYWALFILCFICILCPDAYAEEKMGVQIYRLENKAALGEAEIAYLFEMIFSVFSSLTPEQFQVTEAEREDGCDELCALTANNNADRLLFGTVTPVGNGYGVVLKLYDAKNKHLISSETTHISGTMDELLTNTRASAKTIRNIIEPLTEKSDVPILSPVPTETEKKAPLQSTKSITGKLTVTTKPPGASVYISREEGERGELVGNTPVEKILLPTTYWVSIQHPGYIPINQTKVRIDPGEEERFASDLTFYYPANPFKIAGHITFWTGIALLPLGIIGTYFGKRNADKYHNDGYEHHLESARTWTGVMWGAFISSAVLLYAGTTFWIKSPGDKTYYNRKHGIKGESASLGAGGTLSYVRRF